MRASGIALPTTADLTAAGLKWARRAATIAERRRWWIVAACVVGTWLWTWQEALHDIPHNGWLYSSGDDGSWYWTTAWTQSSLHVPVTAIGVGWPYLLTPFAAIFGPNMADGMPAVIALDVLVLAPAAVVGMYLLGSRLAGRLFGVWSAVLWTVLPPLALHLTVPRHRPVILDFLPTALGLNALSDFPSAVCAIYCAWLTLRAYDSRRIHDGGLAGIALGFLVLIKPANAPLAVAAVALLVVGFRWRAVAATIAAAIPAAVTLSLWKQEGRGVVPALSNQQGSGATSSNPVAAVNNAQTYVNINLHHLASNAHAIDETFWSLRALEFVLLAGSFGLLRRARLRGALIVAWLVAFVLIKGTVSYSNVYDTTFYRFLLPAWPAWVLIAAGVVFCWPGGGATRPDVRPVAPPGRWSLAAVGILFAALPLALVLADSPAPLDQIVQQNAVGAPIAAVDFGLTARQTGPHTVLLRWRPQGTRRATTGYVLYKARTNGCTLDGPSTCELRMLVIGTPTSTSFVDTQALPHADYRIGLVPEQPPVQPDNPPLILVSTPVSITLH